MSRFPDRPESPIPRGLSNREREIIRQYADGADTLSTDARTIFRHYRGDSEIMECREMVFMAAVVADPFDNVALSQARRSLLRESPLVPLHAYPIVNDGCKEPRQASDAPDLRDALAEVHEYICNPHAPHMDPVRLAKVMDTIARFASNKNWVVYVP